jgi:hypothetical protein
MSWSPLNTAMNHVRQRAAPVMAAALMFAGIYELIATLKFPIGGMILRLINAIIIRGFRDRLLLPDYAPMPWWFSARSIATAVIVIVLGIFLGLWVNVRSQRQPNR